MEFRRHKRNLKNHVFIVTSDAPDARMRQIRVRPWLLWVIITVLCVVVGRGSFQIAFHEFICRLVGDYLDHPCHLHTRAQHDQELICRQCERLVADPKRLVYIDINSAIFFDGPYTFNDGIFAANMIDRFVFVVGLYYSADGGAVLGFCFILKGFQTPLPPFAAKSVSGVRFWRRTRCREPHRLQRPRLLCVVVADREANCPLLSSLPPQRSPARFVSAEFCLRE